MTTSLQTLLGKPESSQNHKQKRGKTFENKTRNAHDNQFEKNSRSGHQGEINPGRETKDEYIEIGYYTRSGTGDRDNLASVHGNNTNPERRFPGRA